MDRPHSFIGSSVDGRRGYFCCLNSRAKIFVWTCVFLCPLLLYDSILGAKYDLWRPLVDDTEENISLLGLWFLVCKADLGNMALCVCACLCTHTCMCLAVSGWSEGGEGVLIKKTGSEESWEGETESCSWRGGVTDRSLTSLSSSPGSSLLSW